MDQRSANQTLPLDPHFEIVQSLYRLVSDAQTPSYQIKKHLLPLSIMDQNPATPWTKYPEHGITASSTLTRQSSKTNNEVCCLGDPIKILKERITRQHQIIDHDFAFVAKLLGLVNDPNIAACIVEVCPTVRDITPKPHGVGLLKAMGMLTGLALALALQKQGKWSTFKDQLMRKDTSSKMCSAFDNILILATRRSNDMLLSDVSDSFTRARPLDITKLLLPFLNMEKDKNVTTCRRYLEGFIPALLWPVFPVQGYFIDGSDKFTSLSNGATQQKTKDKRYQPNVEVVANRLFGKDFVKTLFIGGRVSKVWNDAGAGFSELLENTMKSGFSEDDSRPFAKA